MKLKNAIGITLFLALAASLFLVWQVPHASASSTVVEYQIDLFAGSGGTAYDTITATSYTIGPRSCIIYVDTSKFVSPTFYFESVLYVSSTSYTIYCELYDKTSGGAVSSSPVSSSSTTVTRVRSGAITLTSGHEFEYYAYKSSSSATARVYATRLIVVDTTTAGWTKGEEQIEIGDYETTTATSATVLSYQPIYPYNASVRDGTVAVYFEATVRSSSSSGTTYVQLYDSTGSSVVTTVSNAGTTLTRVRSSSITLTDAHNYVVRKYSSSSSYTAYVYDAKLIIQQSGTITKTELYKKTASTQTSTSTSYASCNHQILLTESNLVGSLTFYYQVTLKSSSASYTAFSRLYDLTGSSAVSGSEETTTVVLWTNLKSNSLTLTDAHQFVSQIHESSTSGTCSIASAWVVIDLNYFITITLATTPLTSCNVRLDSGTWYTAPHAFTGLIPDSSHSIEAQDPYIVTANQEQYVWASWSDSGANPHNVTPTHDTTYTATMNHQWYFLVSSTYDSSTGTGWYNAGSSCSGSTVTTPVSGGAGIRYQTTGWTGTGSLSSGGTYGSSSTGSFTINAYSTCTWNWITQYQPTITLTGTTSSLTTSITTRTLNGASNTPSGLYASWSDWCDSDTTLTFSDVNTGGGSATERLHTISNRSWTVTSALTATITYVHQWSPTITLSGTTSSLTVSITVRTLDGSSATASGLYTSWSNWCDDSTTLTFSTTNTGGGSSTEHLHTISTTSWSVTSAFSATITYIHQWKPTITLTGTTSSLTVSITVRTLDGSSNTPSGLYTSWTDWCDDSTTLTFSTSNTGGGSSTERIHTAGTVSWSITSALSQTITYIHQWKPSITLGGTLSGDTVDITARTLDGSSATASGLYTSWNDWCDDSTTLTFSATSTSGKQCRSTTARSWTVSSAFSATPIWDRMKVTSYSVSDSRANINDNVNIDATLVYEYDNTQVTTGTITINGYSASYQGGGVYRITRTKSTVTSVTYNTVAGSETTYGLSTVNQNSQSTTVIWDRLQIQSYTVSDSRANINDNVNIDALIWFDYDDTVCTTATITINGYSATHQGSGVYRITRTSASVTSVIYNTVACSAETAYGITTVDQNAQSTTVIWDKARIYYEVLDDSRVDINTNMEFRVKGLLLFDNHVLGLGDTVTANFGALSWDAVNSWFDGARSQVTVGNYTFTVSSLSEATYGITSFEINVTNPTGVWDRIEIYYMQLDDSRVDVGTSIEFRVKARLDYDDHALGSSDSVTANFGTLTWDSTNGWFDGVKSQSSVGSYTFNVSSGNEATYEITTIYLAVSSPTGIWDRIKIYAKDDPNISQQLNVDTTEKSLSDVASPFSSMLVIALLLLSVFQRGRKRSPISKVLCIALILLLATPFMLLRELASASDQTVPSNSYVMIWFKARYDYDNASYTDQSSSILSINGTLATYNATGGYWQLNVTQSEGTYYYVVSAVSDGVYGLTTFYDGIGAIKVIWIAPGYNLNLRVMDYDLRDAISGALVYKDSDVKTSDANGWANWTLVSGTVQIKVQYYGFWVNGTFSLSMDSDKTIDVRCKLYDVTVLVQEGVQNAYLAGANVTVYNSTSVQGNKITSGVTENNGQVQLLNLPNNTLTFTQYGGASYSLVIGNATRLVSSENQAITLTADQNNVNTNNNYSIIAFAGMIIPFKSSFVTKRLKKKMQKRSETNEGSSEEVLF